MTPDRSRGLQLAGGPVYTLCRALFLICQALLARAKFVGIEHVPRSGGILVVSNHQSNIDPLLLTAAIPRPVAFMTKIELYRPWYLRLLARLTGAAFPVRRGQIDTGAVRRALHLIEAGAAVLVFPEGTRSAGGLGEGHPGVAYIATRARCPVLPIGIVGTEAVRSLRDLCRRPDVEVRFGKPYQLDRSSGSARRVLAVIMGTVAELLPPGRRGVYAGEAATTDTGDVEARARH